MSSVRMKKFTEKEYSRINKLINNSETTVILNLIERMIKNNYEINILSNLLIYKIHLVIYYYKIGELENEYQYITDNIKA